MARTPATEHAHDVRRLSPLRDFLRTESAGAVLLAVGALAALVWANSPWSASYESLWSSRVAVTVAGHSLDLDLRHWVNDGLMTMFFLVVGLEIKRELTHGHLADRRAALLPGLAAVGGMVVPALVYLAVAGSTEPRGWAIPVATDIALAVGVLSVAGSRVPPSLRAFLLGLAIVDDIGAIVIIAAVYSTGVSFGWLAVAVAGVVVAVVVRRIGVRSVPAYVVVGSFVWLGLYQAGVHPTLAGVVMGVLAPATPLERADLVDRDDVAAGHVADDVEAVRAASQRMKGTVSVVEWLQHVLHPWTGYVIVPVFALANSGIHLSVDGLRDAAGSPITWGVFLGLLLGKPLGIMLATGGAVRADLADRPAGAMPRQLLGVGSAAGIGFTVAIFITKLALPDATDQSNAKLAILLASVLAALASSALLLARSGGRPAEG